MSICHVGTSAEAACAPPSSRDLVGVRRDVYGSFYQTAIVQLHERKVCMARKVGEIIERDVTSGVSFGLQRSTGKMELSVLRAAQRVSFTVCSIYKLLLRYYSYRSVREKNNGRSSWFLRGDLG